MMNYFDMFSKRIVRVSNVLGSIVIVCMTLIVTVDVLLRNLTGFSILIATEVSSYLLVALSMIGLAYTERMEKHIDIDLITKKLPLNTQKKLNLVVSVMSILFITWLIYITMCPVIKHFAQNTRSVTILRVPMWITYFLVPIGFTMQLIVMVNKFLKDARSELFYSSKSDSSSK